MEEDDNSNSKNQFNDKADQNLIVQQLQRTSISRKTKQWRWYDIRNFPDALLIEVLARLPVKSVFMCKSVCKHWQTLISQPSFCRFYHSILNSNAALSRPFRILGKYTYVPNFTEFINRLRLETHSSSEFSVLFLSSREDPVRREDNEYNVLNMSNGLILCRWHSSTQLVYYICDPLTGQSITLPRREDAYQGNLVEEFVEGQLVLYVCDPLTGQWNPIRRRDESYVGNLVEGLVTRVNEDRMLTGYTVVKLDLGNPRSNYLNLEMFSFETGKWVGYKIPFTIPIRTHELGTVTVHAHGALHWVVRKHDTYGTHVLLAFDPYKDPKSVRLIPLPHDRDLWSERQSLGTFQLCGECDGTLRYFEVANPMFDEDYLFSMWAMKDYEKGEWCCEFKVRRGELHSDHPELSKWLLAGYWFVPLQFHSLNPNVVYLICMDPECAVSYDVLNRRLDVVRKPFDKDAGERISWISAIPFMLPTWPLLVSSDVSISKDSSSKLKKNLTY